MWFDRTKKLCGCLMAGFLSIPGFAQGQETATHDLHFSHPLVAESVSPDTKLRFDYLFRDEEGAGNRHTARVEGEYAFSPSVVLRLRALAFAIEIDSIDGSIVEADADLTWQPTRHFGAGIGVRYFNTNVKSTGSDLNGEFDYEYVGPVVYIQTTF